MTDEQGQALIEENKRLRDNLGALQRTVGTLMEDYARISKAHSMTQRQAIVHQLVCASLAFPCATSERWEWVERLYAEGISRGIYPAEPTGSAS